ncbi:hypothetical protein NON20_01360 [Synechocystis sp. B12]|jgi:hypothetical protein|uniref:hypothetical protein n=1 Tax=unclassified Synechocystis TaxID=2640012 RepID=UPI0002A598B4|nr:MULTISPECIES: hypothetical protein [unclassified Synechocystis]WLT38547.1 hypothetical protein NON20_01360 [Synechocystis sp. B12]BAM54066.1 Predicted membrane protein [Synechocystis sp. PCC 6803] [Bacillus subtilis BEST7613]ALJ68562.1 hypothetical protein AOY38_12380 [Synechocystis sp. PCC 6803]AVP90407.1 hypothetical protein C7I86_12460 [Synechocystis sp. IPPAS B-1465]MBD2616854.1 hypothetical protein [Synechocystis sp. FACHB-898]
MASLFKILRSLAIPAVIAGLAFISIGDMFLPDPWASYSKNTREQINQKLLGMAPKPNIKKPSEMREKQLEQLK